MDEEDRKPAAKEDHQQNSPAEKSSASIALDVVDLTEEDDPSPHAKKNGGNAKAAATGGAAAEDEEEEDDEYLDSDVDSDDSHHAWDAETLAAVARTTHHQMIKRQPILIGCNRDGSINVQLPNGNIIVAERSAFPKFDKTGPLDKQRQSQHIKKDQFAFLARKEKMYTDQIPRTWEIEHFLHVNASSIFHVFDRRVNLDLLSPSCSNYELLRAWAQDDPYRYTPPPVALPIDRQINNKEEEGKQQLVQGKPLKLKRKASWKPHFVDSHNVAQTLREQTVAPSIEELRAAMIQRGKHRRLIYTQHLHTSDEAVIAQMVDDGMFQKR